MVHIVTKGSRCQQCLRNESRIRKRVFMCAWFTVYVYDGRSNLRKWHSDYQNDCPPPIGQMHRGESRRIVGNGHVKHVQDMKQKTVSLVQTATARGRVPPVAVANMVYISHLDLWLCKQRPFVHTVRHVTLSGEEALEALSQKHHTRKHRAVIAFHRVVQSAVASFLPQELSLAAVVKRSAGKIFQKVQR